MKNFFKIVFGSCLGVLLFFGLGILILMGIGLSQSGKNDVRNKSILTLNLSGLTPEKTNNIAKNKFDFESPEKIGIRHMKRLIKNAETDANIEGILIKNSGNPTGRATLKSIRKSLEEFKETDKFIYAYGDYYTQNAYYLSSVADSLFINPNGSIDLRGIGATIPYFKDVLDKYGVKMNVFYAGKFKSATESFRRNDMSPENRVQTREYLTDIMDVMTDEISKSRNISESDLNDFINDFKGLSMSDILSYKIADRSLFWHELEGLLKEKSGIKENKKLRLVNLEKYASSSELKKSSKSKNKVAIVYAEGEIGYNADGNGNISNDKYIKIFRKLDRTKDLKAVVLRVNSPGGSALTSDLILQEVIELQKKGIPVIASYGDYAASGGYYISCSADTIVSEENTLTGSIGVFGMIPNLSQFYEEQLNLNFDTITTNPYAVMMNTAYPLSDREGQKIQGVIDELYDRFLTRVSNGRDMSKEVINEIAQGRVWSGTDAKEIGLVDEIGDLDRAIAIAVEKAGLEDYKILEYPYIKENPFLKMMNEIVNQETRAMLNPLSEKEQKWMNKYRELTNILEEDKGQARLPFMIIE